MACVAEDNPCFVAGDDLFYDIIFTDSDEVAIDLTGATADMDLRDPVTNAVVAQVMSGGIVTPLEGAMRFTLTDIETAALLPRTEDSASWAFSVKLKYLDGTKQTILAGMLKLTQAATE